MKRKMMSRSSNKRSFRKGSRTHKYNAPKSMSRGGIRL